MKMVMNNVCSDSTLYNNIYQNPAEGQLNILWLDNSDFKIEIYNTIGQLELAVNNSNRTDISALEKGIYFIKIQLKNSSKIIKFVKQ